VGAALKWLRRFSALLIAMAAPAVADDYSATLALFQKALSAHPSISSATINAADQSITVVFTNGITLTANPDNMDLKLKAAATQDERAAILQNQVASIVQIAAAAKQPKLSPNDIGLLRPVIRASDFMKELPADTVSSLVAADFLPGLSVFYVIDREAYICYVTQEELKDLGLSETALESAALNNLQSELGKLNLQIGSADPLIAVASMGGTYEGSLLLLTDYWKKLEHEHGPLVIGNPSRGMLYVGSLNHAQTVEMLRKTVAEDFATLDHSVSPRLLAFENGKWRWLDEQ
jgi:uncharacterized protein YtpQ (UPF0354 family)